MEEENGEEFVDIRPHVVEAETRLGSEFGETVNAEFVGVLGADGFFRAKLD